MAVIYFTWQGTSASKGKTPSIRLRLLIHEEGNIQEAAGAALAATSFRYGNLYRDNISLDAIGPHTWEAVVEYRLPDSTQVAEITMSTTTRSVRVTWALETVATYGNPRIQADGLIGATLDNGELKVEGADVLVPQTTVSISIPADPFVVTTAAFARKMAAYVGRVNSDNFYGFAPGELLFIGASARGQFETNPENTRGSISYEFAFEPNLANLNVGGVVVAQKRGHDVLDVEYEGNLPGVQFITTTVRAVKVHRIYEYVPFAGLL